MKFCGNCGGKMVDLLFSRVCSNDCDRVPEAVLGDERTEPYVRVRLRGGCDNCGSIDVEPFVLENEKVEHKHCWNCGSVFEAK